MLPETMHDLTGDHLRADLILLLLSEMSKRHISRAELRKVSAIVEGWVIALQVEIDDALNDIPDKRCDN